MGTRGEGNKTLDLAWMDWRISHSGLDLMEVLSAVFVDIATRLSWTCISRELMAAVSS